VSHGATESLASHSPVTTGPYTDPVPRIIVNLRQHASVQSFELEKSQLSEPFVWFFHETSGRRAAKRKEKKRKDPKYPTANPGIGRADVLQAILDEEH
jgi:hypothetical protein